MYFTLHMKMYLYISLTLSLFWCITLYRAVALLLPLHYNINRTMIMNQIFKVDRFLHYMSDIIPISIHLLILIPIQIMLVTLYLSISLYLSLSLYIYVLIAFWIYLCLLLTRSLFSPSLLLIHLSLSLCPSRYVCNQMSIG